MFNGDMLTIERYPSPTYKFMLVVKYFVLCFQMLIINPRRMHIIQLNEILNYHTSHNKFMYAFSHSPITYTIQHIILIRLLRVANDIDGRFVNLSTSFKE